MNTLRCLVATLSFSTLLAAPAMADNTEPPPATQIRLQERMDIGTNQIVTIPGNLQTISFYSPYTDMWAPIATENLWQLRGARILQVIGQGTLIYDQMIFCPHTYHLAILSSTADTTWLGCRLDNSR